MHDSADARAALLATYMARRANAQADTVRATPCPLQTDGDGEGAFGARGRTIYNANGHPLTGGGGTLGELARIDTEEGGRREWGKDVMDEPSSSRETTPSAAEVAIAEEMFALYIEKIFME